MCVPNSPDVAEGLGLAVDELIAEGSPFTAYNVTQRCRDNLNAVGIKDFFRHGDVRVYIHEILEEFMDDGVVSRGQSPSHPAFQYTPTTVSTVTPPAGGIAPAVAAPVSTATVHKSTLSRDKRGRVCLLKADVASLGASKGNVIHAEEDNGTLKIGFKSNLNKPFAYYTVDKDGNVRVSSGVLARAGIPKTQSQVTVENDGSVLVIS